MEVGYIYTKEGGRGWKRNDPTRAFRSVIYAMVERRVCARTSLDFVRLGVVPDVGRLGLRDLHETVFLDLRQRNVGLVPL